MSRTTRGWLTLDETDARQEKHIVGLEKRELLVLWCVIIGAIGSIAQVWESVVVTLAAWRIR